MADKFVSRLDSSRSARVLPTFGLFIVNPMRIIPQIRDEPFDFCMRISIGRIHPLQSPHDGFHLALIEASPRRLDPSCLSLFIAMVLLFCQLIDMFAAMIIVENLFAAWKSYRHVLPYP